MVNTACDIQIDHVFEFNEVRPTIRIYENDKLKREFLIETLSTNSDLAGQYFHSSVRILKNDACMIDGIVSRDRDKYPTNIYEGVRLQPFYLSARESENEKLVGKGLFQRGLHFAGRITPTTVRSVCICDFCYRSFTLCHFHAGFSEMQYFYSGDSSQTLVVAYYEIPNLPVELQKNIDPVILRNVEAKLPLPTNGSGDYKYYNSFLCPHCKLPFIDFEKNSEIRPTEYYGNHFINHLLQRLTEK